MFVKVTGQPNDPKSIIVDVLGFHIMDVGTAGYTEFDYDESIIDQYEKHPEYMDCRMGMLHSHNSMPTFFSRTDIEELEDNTKGTDFMVSLIVNNASKYTAKIAWRTDEEVHIETIGWFNKQAIKSKYTRTNSSLYTIDLDIEIEGIEDVVNIDLRIDEVVELKEEKAKLAKLAAEAKRIANTPLRKEPTFAGEKLQFPVKQREMFHNLEEIEDDSLSFTDLAKRRAMNSETAGVIPPMEGETFDNLIACLIVQDPTYQGTFMGAMGTVKRKVAEENIPMLVELITDNLEDFFEEQYGELCTMESYMEMVAAFVKNLREFSPKAFPLIDPLTRALNVQLGDEDSNGMFP